ncbi:MAG: restriction endonuclease [Acinetobacter sp.]|nr:restriction endonuclease [Acinetobacter sp.]
MLPLLSVMQSNNKIYSLSEAYKELLEILDCSEEDKNATMEDGRNIIFYRLQWAKTYLKKAGLLEYPEKAHFRLTQAGFDLNIKELKKIDSKYLSQFKTFKEFRKTNSINENKFDNVVSVEFEENNNYEELTPPEIIFKQSKLLRDEISTELLSLVKNNTPKFFEKLVVDLLVAMGYGGSHQDAAQAIGKTNDGGIDGVISEDRLGLDKIYIQAKRWENTVGRPEIQQFKGALADQVAKKGVFITTSNFSKEAIESAKKSGIVLIDGDKLTSLMIEFGLGVQIERSFHIYKIDQDRFDEDNF